jgi:hypothetical protein
LKPTTPTIFVALERPRPFGAQAMKTTKAINDTTSSDAIAAATANSQGTPSGKGPGEAPLAYDPEETFLTDSQVEKRWNAKDGYMSELRAQGTGPPHVRLSPRIIRYRLGDILAYEQAQRFDSNAAALQAARSETPINDGAPAPKRVVRSRSRPGKLPNRNVRPEEVGAVAGARTGLKIASYSPKSDRPRGPIRLGEHYQ